MNTRIWILSGVLLTFPVLGWSGEPHSSATSGKPVFNLKSARVQESIRTAARTHVDIKPEVAAVKSADEPPPIALAGQTSIPFRAPLRPHHVKCDNASCTAYTADDATLYSVPRSQYYGERIEGSNKMGAWLTCQSRDNLLTTFERYDKCRGITIGLPLTFGNTVVAAPGLSF
jgi:hypothetical protein